MDATRTHVANMLEITPVLTSMALQQNSPLLLDMSRTRRNLSIFVLTRLEDLKIKNYLCTVAL
jgi:hypothetical protein